MKNVVKMLVCLLLAVMTLSPACAEGIVCAAQMLEMDDLSYYPGYVCDEETGRWSVHAYQADALLDRFWNYGIQNSNRTVVFHLAAEGDARTGVWTPVLHFYSIDGETINARAVSLMVGEERYDLAASSSVVSRGRYTAECITVPLNAESLQLVKTMQQAEEVTVRLIGQEMYTVTISRTAGVERRMLEGASLDGLNAGMALLEEIGADGYQLWDLSAESWEQAYGYRPTITRASVTDTLCDMTLTDEMGMIVPEDYSDAADAAQQALIDHGFLSGSVYWKYDSKAVDAALRAQKYLNRVPTGCFDAALLDALAAGRQETEEDAVEMCKLGETAQIGLKRYWFADGVSAAQGGESLRSVANADNVFLAADGVIRNLSAEELHLFMQVEASVVYNGQYAFEAELVCECSDGTELDTLLLPLAQARLIVYAEIPAALAEDAQAEWTITFAENGESLEFDLQ